MPYKRIGDVNKAILGIRPRVTLDQANEIAAMADAIAEEDSDMRAWPIAIGQWKKSHTVRGGKWVSRTELKKQKEDDMSKTEMSEAVTKTVAGKQFPAGDFLVTEDPESPNSWHMQVSDHGKPDHRLMGAAWAALHGGYRGNKYEGPNKAEALRKLKALYKSEDMELPAAESDAVEMEVWEQPETPPYFVTSFADLRAMKNAEESSEKITELTWQLQTLISNCMASPDITDKSAAIRGVLNEFAGLVDEALGIAQSGGNADEQMEVAIIGDGDTDATRTTLSEADIELIEREPPLVLDMAIIAPGWGNKRDSNYYSREMLAREAQKFSGAMMYATDHVAAEKNVFTQVGRVRGIKGFTDDGSPIGEVAIWNGQLAADVRRRAEVGELDTLHCSILAKGRVREFEKDGRKGNYVESIEEVLSVDLVTKAGAGGHALRLVEADMNEDVKEAGQLAESEAAPVEAAATETDAVEVAPVEDKPVTPSNLTEAEVSDALAATQLPSWARDWLAEGNYSDYVTLAAAVERATERVRKVTRAGEVFGQGEIAPQAAPTPEELKARGDARFSRIMREVGMTQ